MNVTTNRNNTCASLMEHKIALTAWSRIERLACLLEPTKKLVVYTETVGFCKQMDYIYLGLY